MPSLIPGLEAIDMSGSVSQIMYWAGIFIISGLVLGGLWAVYYYVQYNIKVKVVKLYGSNKDGQFAFGKETSNRAKWVNNRQAWRSLFPLFNKKNRSPIDPEYIYPGNACYVFDLDGEWIPGRRNINIKEGEIRAEINPVPYELRNWQSFEHKRNAIEFAEHDFWTENKYFFMVIICVAICAAICIATVYFTYEFSTAGVAKSAALTDAIKSFGNIPSK